MSVRLMSMVFETQGIAPSKKLVLLSLADHANDEGRSIYPGVKRLVARTGLSERTVQSTLRALENDDHLIAPVGVSEYGTTEYAIDVQALAQYRGGATVAPPRKSRTGGVQILHPGGATVAPKPSVKSSVKPSEANAPKNGRAPDPLFDAVAEVTQADPLTAGASIGKVRAILSKAGYSAADVLKFGKLWWGDKFHTGPPSVWQVQQQIGRVRANGNGRSAPAPLLTDADVAAEEQRLRERMRAR